MKRTHLWAWGAAGGLLLVGGMALAVWAWLPGDEALRSRLETSALAALGTPVRIGQAHLQLLPVVVVVLEDVRTLQDEPIVLARIAVYPQVLPLLRKVLAVDRLEIDGAQVPRGALRAFRGRVTPPDVGFKLAPLPLSQVVFRDLTWVSYSGIATVFDGEVDFDARWRPRQAVLRRPGAPAPFSFTLARDGDADRWQVRTVVAGGTAHGQLTLHELPELGLALSGELAPSGIDLPLAMSTFNRHSPIGGKASARTVVRARGHTLLDLVRSLHTTSDVTVAQAVVLKLDLDKAVRSLGSDRAGQTRLDSLTARLDTQNTDEGIRFSYTRLQAKAGSYSATGEAEVYRGQLQASGRLSLAGRWLGLPFVASGPVAKPLFRMSPPPPMRGPQSLLP